MTVGRSLISKFFTKVDTWSRAINLDGFKASIEYRWQLMGQYFAKYASARIYRRQNQDIPVYFTVEANGEEQCLKYKLDYQYTGANKLSAAQVQIFDRIIGDTEARTGYVDASDLHTYTWEGLITDSQSFFQYYIPLYDEIIDALRTADSDTDHPAKNRLTLKSIPEGIIAPPDWQPMEDMANADYDEENKQKKEMGPTGKIWYWCWNDND